MPIEKQIENLIKAIEANTYALLAMQQQISLPAQETTSPASELPPVPTVEDFVELDREGLKDLALNILRDKPEHKQIIKAYLAEYGASTIAKLKDEHLADVQDFLEQLK